MKAFRTALAMFVGISVWAQAPAPKNQTDEQSKIARVERLFEQSPLTLEPNRGQAPSGVDFIALGLNHRFLLNSKGATVQISGSRTKPSDAVHFEFVGSNPSSAAEGLDRASFTSSYWTKKDLNNHLVQLPNYSKVRYRQTWPGIDVIYYGQRSLLEYDMVVAPGANPDAIRIRLEGQRHVSLNTAGDLLIATNSGSIVHHKPLAYQMIAGQRREVSARYALAGRDQVRIQFGKYDSTQELVIDPTLALSVDEVNHACNTVAVDGAGNIYLGGTNNDAAVPGGLVFLLKTDPTGLGLSIDNFPGVTIGRLAMTSSGVAYVTGSTNSPFFRTSASAFQANLADPSGSNTDAFFMSYIPGSNVIDYGTFFGGIGADLGTSAAFDSSGNGYITGQTNGGTGFVTTEGAAYGGGGDAFLAEFNPHASGSASLVFSTYLGGTGTDIGNGIAIDSSNTVYVGGSTTSTSATFHPTSSTGYNTSKTTTTADGFILKVTNSGSVTTYLTFLPKAPINAIAVDINGAAYVTGAVDGTTNALVTTSTGYQLTNGGGSGTDAFLSKYDTTVGGVPSLLYSTYLGGNLADTGLSVAIDSNFNAYVVGQTSSTNFPTVRPISGLGTYQGGPSNGFVAKINTLGAGQPSLVYSTFLGGGTDGSAFHNAMIGGVVAVGCAAYVGGTATSVPLVPNNPGEQTPGFLAKIVDDVPLLSITKSHAGSFTEGQQNATYTIAVKNAGCGATTGTVTVTDAVPAGLNLVSMAGTGWTCSSNSCNRSDALAANASYPSITVTVNVALGAGSPVVNQATVSGGGADTVTASDSTVVNVFPPSLSITKTHSGNFTQGQQNATYTVTVSNAANAGLTSGTVTVTEQPPAGLSFVSMAGVGWNCSSNTCTRTDALNPGSSYSAITVTVNVNPSATSPQVNQVTVSGGGSSNANASDSTVINANPAVLSISKTHTGNFVQGQANAIYTVTVSNGASAGPTSGTVTVTDTVPSGLTFVSMSGTGWTCVSNSCSRSDALNTGASYPAITVTVNVGASATSPQINQVAVTGGGSAGANTSDSTNVVTGSQPSLVITKAHSGNFTQGQQGATYTLTVTNTAATASTTGVVTVTETVPSGLTFVSMSGTGWTCVSNSCNRSDVLAHGAAYPAITVTVNVAANASSPQVNQASVSGGGSPSGNTSDSTVINSTGALLSITKSHVGNFIQGQQNATYTVTVSNGAGSGPTSGTVTVTDTVPSALTLASMSGTGWSCSGNSCNRSDALAAGASYPAIAVKVNVATNASSPQVNSVSASGGGSPTASTTDSTNITVNNPTLTVDRSILNFGYNGSLITSPQFVTVNFTGGLGLPWTASSNKANIVVNPTSGTGTGTFTVTVTPGQSGVITVTSAGSTGSPKTITVNVASVIIQPPFGSFDTPTNNTTGVVGAVAVTGWALDNIEVKTVGIWREPVGSEVPTSNGLVFISNAGFVADARPDVQTSYSDKPWQYRAGWGYQLLTNFLPALTGPSGNGTYKLHAIMTNAAGNTVDLGAHTIVVDNAHAAKPFGTLDTPGQGGTASGSQFVNFGWALTPNPACIPIDGSTLQFTVDSVAMPGHPVYNQVRSDIATAFPGYCNTTNGNGAIGYYIFDTTALTNGVHTTGWIAYDNQGRGEGLGSRFFNVLNTGSTAAPEIPPTPETLAGGVRVRRGISLHPREEQLTPVAGGYQVELEELGRMELIIGAAKGHMMVGADEASLPVGSSLRGGVFYWQPAVGFLGEYQLVFERPDATQIHVRVNIVPKRYGDATSAVQ